MTEIFTGLNRFWRRFGDSKKLNFAKAFAEYLAEKLSIPISNSKQLSALRKFLERHLGGQLAEAGEDGLTILAKTLIHAPDRLIAFLSAITGRPKADVTVVVNQFLDELVKGIIKNHHSFETQAEAKDVIVQVAAMQDDDVKAADADKALTEILSVKYAYDTRRKDVHFIGCDEVNEFVNVREEGGGDGKDGKKGPRKVKKLKAHVRELTLGDLLEFGIDPLGFSPGCCGGVKASDLRTATKEKSSATAKPGTFFLCLVAMKEDGREIDARVRSTVQEWRRELGQVPGLLPQFNLEHLLSEESVKEVCEDYFAREIWTPALLRFFVDSWNPTDDQTPQLKLHNALDRLHGIAPAKPKPKPETPGRLDRFINGAVDFWEAYWEGNDNAPIIGTVRTSTVRVTTSLEQGTAGIKTANQLARQIRSAGK